MLSSRASIVVCRLGLLVLAAGCAEQRDVPWRTETAPLTSVGADLCRLEPDGALSVSTARLAIVVRDGMVESVKNLRTGEVHAEPPSTPVAQLPRGLGWDPTGIEAAKLHSQWGEYALYSDHPVYHRPLAGEPPLVENTPGACSATWTGLTNGIQEFDETLRLDFALGGRGELMLRATGESPAAGVFGVTLPIVNLHADHGIYVPSHGGVRYDRQMTAGVRTLDRPPFFEAPVVAMESRRAQAGSTVALWIEDPSFRSNAFFLSWTGELFGLAIEQLHLMHREPNVFREKRFDGNWWHLDAFLGGWIDGMEPYKSWYANTFASERARRTEVTWPRDIKVIVDQYIWPGDPEADASHKELAAEFGPHTLIYESQARAHAFDEGHPDYTPLPVYPGRNRVLESYGFRTMGYVNSYVANFESEAFERYDLRNNALPRLYWSLFDLSGSVERQHTFENATPGELLYLDPLAPAWPDLHIALMQEWNVRTEFDANYEDTAGAAGDFGNGVVGGFSGAVGSTAMFRRILERHNVPMASEWGPDAMAFATWWPLRMQQTWGDPAWRQWLITHQRPVSSYLYGPDQAAWVPTVYARDNFHRHVVVATSDALGGVAQFEAMRGTYRATQGSLGHAKRRARLFASAGLRPTFPRELGTGTLVSAYEADLGGRYEYHVTDSEQRMLGPDGRAVYARIGGMTSHPTDLVIPGWPASANGVVFGLDPSVSYDLARPGDALTPSSPEIVVTSLSAGAKVGKYYETPGHVVLVIEGLSEEVTQATARVHAHVAIQRLWLNDEPAPVPPYFPTGSLTATGRTYQLTLPARFVLTKRDAAAPAIGTYWGSPGLGHYVELESGIDRGGAGPAWAETQMIPDPGVPQPTPALLPGMAADAPQILDYLVTVPLTSVALEVYVCAYSGDTSRGIVAINGRAVVSARTRNACNQERAKRLLIPLSELAGREILVSLWLDPGHGLNHNSDYRLLTVPRFVAP